MKRQFVESLREGDRVNDVFVAVRKDLREQPNGGKFLGMVFKDRTGDIGGILWNNATAVARLFEAGDVVNVRGAVTSYQDRLQIRVDQVLPIRQGEFDPADLVYIPEDIGEVRVKYVGLLATIGNEWLKRLVQVFLDDGPFMERFAKCAAGKKWHHAYPGGLIRHCYETARLTLSVCEVFPNVDRDLMLAAVFLHDIGKTQEMHQDLFVDYTTSGKLLGHVLIGLEMVQEKIASIEGFPENLKLQLLHCVASHHGELINGSPVVPKTLEALVLYHCDNLDAQADAFTRVIEETRQKNQQWSEYLTLIDRQIWTKEERSASA